MRSREEPSILKQIIGALLFVRHIPRDTRQILQLESLGRTPEFMISKGNWSLGRRDAAMKQRPTRSDRLNVETIQGDLRYTAWSLNPSLWAYLASCSFDNMFVFTCCLIRVSTIIV